MQQDRNSLLQTSGSTRTANAFEKSQLVTPGLEATRGSANLHCPQFNTPPKQCPVSTSWVLGSTCGICNTDSMSFILMVLKSFQPRQQAGYFDAVLCSYHQNTAGVFPAR